VREPDKLDEARRGDVGRASPCPQGQLSPPAPPARVRPKL
jgi:hypothetical protein